MHLGVQGFVADMAALGLNPRVEAEVVVCEVEPVDGTLAGTRVETGVALAELAAWPQTPPHWVHIPESIEFPRTNSRASPKAGWLRHSRHLAGWGDAEPGVTWAAHVRAVLSEAATGPVSVAMTAATEEALVGLLLRDDGQEDLCLATYRPSTGAARISALIGATIPPEPDDRHVDGKLTITAEYVLRGIDIAQRDDCGLAVLHSHPRASGWQTISALDRDAESSYANLVRETTGFPLVGMTLAGRDRTWSARHWNFGAGRQVDCTHATNVRVVGEQLAVSWNDALCPSPLPSRRQVRTVSAWGERRQADLARRRILVVGAGSVGLDVIVRLAASGQCRLTVMDFDFVQPHNLDRLIGATLDDALSRRSKVHVARRQASLGATALTGRIDVSCYSICEPEGLWLALDHDLIFSCVDRPWPRAVLNALAYSDLIPVIDGGIAIDTFEDGTMRNATWRSHVIRPQRPCMSCNRQLDLGQVPPDRLGLLDDPAYIARAGQAAEPANQNVAPLSISVAAALLAQYVSFSAAPGGFGEPGPLQYTLSTHNLERRDDTTRSLCPVEAEEAAGDQRIDLTGRHERAERCRRLADMRRGGWLAREGMRPTSLRSAGMSPTRNFSRRSRRSR